MRTIKSQADIREGLDALARADPVIAAVRAETGEVPLNWSQPGFAGLVQIIMAQQLSKFAAEAIWRRLCARVRPMTPERLSRTREATLRGCGLSAAKVATVRALAQALRAGQVDLDGIDGRPAEDVIDELCQIKGIGPWTAELYLLFGIGHADIWPAGDLALQVAVGEALELAERPNARAVAEIAARWRPWRGVAARLFWSYYRVRRGNRGGAPV
ncbi:MAG: DNA-3-methyladenine glycosylase 2 family protein [Hyphomicrobiales bacterium]|nr:DNA-3-methyladenine glycosylase 2 family protein [Hyphomicrobiales bacterium]